MATTRLVQYPAWDPFRQIFVIFCIMVRWYHWRKRHTKFFNKSIFGQMDLSPQSFNFQFVKMPVVRSSCNFISGGLPCLLHICVICFFLLGAIQKCCHQSSRRGYPIFFSLHCLNWFLIYKEKEISQKSVYLFFAIFFFQWPGMYPGLFW